MAKSMTTCWLIYPRFANGLFYCPLQYAFVDVVALLPGSASHRISGDRSARCWEKVLPSKFSGRSGIFARERERQVHFSGPGAQIPLVRFRDLTHLLSPCFHPTHR